MAPDRSRTLADRLLTLAGAAMVGAALLLFILRGLGGSAAGPDPSPPAVELHHPTEGSLLDLPVEVRFTSDAGLTRVPGGWGTPRFHLHLEIDGREYMPGPTDIRQLPDGSYAWTVGGLASGTRTLRLAWSDTEHRPLDEGATSRVTVTVR